jgi:hypothetical protein
MEDHCGCSELMLSPRQQGYAPAQPLAHCRVGCALDHGTVPSKGCIAACAILNGSRLYVEDMENETC